MTQTSPAQGGAVQRAQYQTKFGSLDDYDKGGVESSPTTLRHYAFSNIFEVASSHALRERVAVGQELGVRARGGPRRRHVALVHRPRTTSSRSAWTPAARSSSSW